MESKGVFVFVFSHLGSVRIIWVGCRNPAQVLPMKKALKIGLSPCEERLCYEHFVDVDRILPLASNSSIFWGLEFLVGKDRDKGAKPSKLMMMMMMMMINPSFAEVLKLAETTQFNAIH